mgnify:FL=1
MNAYTVTFLPDNITVEAASGSTVLQAQIAAGLRPDAPCGGRGTCGKCTVAIAGQEVLACRTPVDRDLTVLMKTAAGEAILATGLAVSTTPEGRYPYVLAFDVGTTTVVAYLMDGYTGAQIATASSKNSQGQFGADVISRIEYALRGSSSELQACIQETLNVLTKELCSRAGIPETEIGAVSLVGNTAMHHLLLGIDPGSLVTPPYMPNVFEAMELDRGCQVRILPNIAGFVGGDTVGCMVATRFDRLEKLSLLIDIGTNGEMVMGDSKRRIACSTAAGPAFEGAKISCGMRGAEGAVDHVWLEDGTVKYHVIGEAAPVGLCGSGLLDLVAVLLELEMIDESGYLEQKEYRLCDNVILTQKDIREVQLAKAAIRAGIELLAENLNKVVSDIQQVYLAGAFGNYLTPASACRIGMIPPVLLNRILPIGNAAGEGAKLCALNREEFLYSQLLARETEFLELASLPQFQDCYVDALEFSEEEE